MPRKKRNKSSTPAWPLGEIVQVEFMDACTNGKWQTVNDQLEQSHPTLCRSIGYLLRSDCRAVVVAQSMSSSTGHCADTMSIPRGAVKRVMQVKLS